MNPSEQPTPSPSLPSATSVDRPQAIPAPRLSPLPSPAPSVVQSASRARRPARDASRLPRRLRTVQQVQAIAAQQNSACIPLLIRALGSQDDLIRREARRALPQFGEASMIALLRAAAHARGQVREEAVGCLGEWGDVRAFQPLLLALKNERRERTVHTTLLYIGAFVGAMFTASREDVEWWPQVQANTGLRVRACAALGHLGDVRAIVPLIQMARGSDKDVRWAARQSLIQLLPVAAGMPCAQARLLGPEGIPALLSLIFDPDEPLACLALRALGAIGDQRALPGLQRLASDLTRPYARQEAAAILPLLYARCQQEQARSTLLRGANAPHTRAADALLRPALAEPEANAAELLRGVASASSEIRDAATDTGHV